MISNGQGKKTERQRDAERKRASRLKARRVEISVSSATLRRRKARERDIKKWLRYYFPDVFEYDFTENQAAIVHAILTAAREGGDQAIAAPRGDGKTSICECVIIFCVLTGILRFPVIFSATGEDAERILANIKQRLEESEQLVADYPEVCQPAAALEGQANRSSGQVVYGHIGRHKFDDQRSKIKWSGRQIALPIVKSPHSRATGQVIATRGLDAAVRGIRYGTMRPDLAVIDDPETRDIACSEDDRQRSKLELKIDQDIAGCAGQTRRLSRVMLTTLMSRKSLSFKMTAPEQKPSFRGKRFRYMVRPPDRQDLWDEFISLQQADWAAEPRTTKAHEFYLKHRMAMDAGAIVGNPHRRGNEIESSAIESYYVEVARIGRESVATEYDNDPPEETGLVESGITAHRIQTQVSGYEREIIPPGCTVIVQGIDVRKVALHWAVLAFRPDATGYVIDYGVHEVHGTVVGSDEGVDMAVMKSVLARMEETAAAAYCTLDGEVMPVDLTLVDAGWRTDAVYHACQQYGLGLLPSMGIGASAGCVQSRFHAPVRRTADKKPGDGWFMSRRPKGVWLVNMDTDRWKAWVHDRWMTPTDKPGSMFLWGTSGDGGRLSFDEKAHHSYSRHIVAEVEVEELVRGVLTRKWKTKSGNNHWLDATYMACVAANMKGISLLKSPRQKKPESWFAQETETAAPRRAGVAVADGWESS